MRTVLAVAVCLFFAGLGLAHVVSPDRFIAKSAVPKGGEMLTWWNRLEFRAVGAVLLAFALYLLYVVSADGGR